MLQLLQQHRLQTYFTLLWQVEYGVANLIVSCVSCRPRWQELEPLLRKEACKGEAAGA